MKRVIRRIIPILVMTMILVLPIVSFAEGGKVSELEATSQDGVVSINGKASDALSVAVFVYDESGKNLLDVGSTVVNDNKTFTRKVELSDGKYLVKVADYEGGDFASVLTGSTLSQANNDDRGTVKVTSPKTGDMNNSYLWIAIFGTSLLIGVGAVVYKITRA